MNIVSHRKDYLTPDQRWAALIARDVQAEGRFVYGVKTTGIYCRVTCRSRLPNRENVEFFDSAAGAGRAGLRPCKRCRPDVSGHPGQERIRKACRLIEEADEELPLARLAAEVAMSPFHFQRVFRQAVGLTPKQYAKAHRLGRLKAALRDASTVTEAIYDAGFATASRGYDCLTQRLGMPPSAYRAKGQGQQIRYGLIKTALDWMLVAATSRGVCLIAFDTAREALVKELQVRFPKAELCKGDADFERWMLAAARLVEEPATPLALPLDVHGTAFQERVWQALRTIPSGKTMSYSEVAKAIGKPKAVRAVASACGDNPVAVAIPCHRVVGKDGKLHGYRWGVKRKQALLKKESDR